PDFIGHPPVRAEELRGLKDGVVKLPPFHSRQFAAARGRLELMSRTIDRIQLYRSFFFVEEREISFGQQRETVGRGKREIAHLQKRDLLLNRLRNGQYLIEREVVCQGAIGVKLHQFGRRDKTCAWLLFDELHVLLKIVERRLGLRRRSRPRQLPFAA